MTKQLQAGAAAVDITPVDSQFLYGYPFVPRYSTGVHDPLLSSALYLSDGKSEAMFIANDIIWIGKKSTQRIRERICSATAVPAEAIMVTATHTHSGPMTLDYISNEADQAVPKTDPAYVRYIEDRIVLAGIKAFEAAQSAEAGLTCVEVVGLGTNRRDPEGPTDREVPILMIRSLHTGCPLACMLICSMHPTVLHEDSRLISGDFPGLARQYLQNELLGDGCPVLYHTGPAGNQSPRHVTRSNTFDEAERLGALLAKSVLEAIPSIRYCTALEIGVRQVFTDLPRRQLPTLFEAQTIRDDAKRRLEELKRTQGSRQAIRTAEVDWFGAEETLTLARAAAEGRLEESYASVLPAEIQLISIGPWAFVGWQGEIFVEYALAVKGSRPLTYVISLANGELQGYIVTPEAVNERAYEASNALFAPESGRILVERTIELLDHYRSRSR
ncbi:MAG TPA: neutral/alkaline non-lysosomal ceramidase N-terminal domain-containing protein [Acidobacteriota bacterium]|mgnify:CR=1 FL=1|nr:neutral/alkaline non-lysosomal ceramidase N-terminal domain-containing protein [Acidobacteriota bacterium]